VISNAVTIAGAAAGRTFTLTGTSTGANTFLGFAAGVPVAVIKDGPGLWRLNGSTNGGLTVRNGTLQMTSQGGIGSAVSIGDTASASGTAAFLFEQGVSVLTDLDVLGARTVLIGGANTAGVSSLNGEVRMGRDVALVAANNGIFEFAGSWSGSSTSTQANRNVAIGASGYAGRVRLNSIGELLTNGTVSVNFGTAVIGPDSTVTSAGTLKTALGATLAGTGFVTNAIGGAGIVSPGNSPGILTAGSLDPSEGTDFIFEISGTEPDFSSSGNSTNDVLRLTDLSAPFAAPLGLSNVVNVLFNFSGTAWTSGTYRAGFFTDRNVSFASMVQSGSFASFNYWVSGSHGASGNQQQFAVGTDGSLMTYTRLGAFDSNLTVTPSVVSQTANFGEENVVNGQIMQFVVVPEPATLFLAGIGTAVVAWRLRRRLLAA